MPELHLNAMQVLMAAEQHSGQMKKVHDLLVSISETVPSAAPQLEVALTIMRFTMLKLITDLKQCVVDE